ncbi:MAG: endonuclease Q family protein [Patescibacteria group bacterium]
MKVIADLEVHSKYARAVSPRNTLPNISEWAEKKGIGLVGTGDFTHPVWLRELEAQLEEEKKGIYKLKGVDQKTRFLLTSEVSCIYSHKGKGRRVHLMIYLPGFSKVRQFNKELVKLGANLMSDGRPIIGLTLAQVAKIALAVEPDAIIVPAHIWTPWFGFYGHLGGFESLEEAFGDIADSIHTIETGLSSDPAMNWKIEELSNRNIVSFGDAHSPQKLGREATVLEVKALDYENIRTALNTRPKSSTGINSKIAYTIEFYPEEGKYHYTGHRKCNVIYSPKQARKMGVACPVCGRSLTLGVMSRVEQLASREIETEAEKDKLGVRWIKDRKGVRPPYVMLVPLAEIISEALGVGVGSQKVMGVYEQLVKTIGPEFKILLNTPTEELGKVADPKVVEGITRVRSGDIVIEPGYDGVFGKVKIWKDEGVEKGESSTDQATLF